MCSFFVELPAVFGLYGKHPGANSFNLARINISLVTVEKNKTGLFLTFLWKFVENARDTFMRAVDRF